MKNVWLVLVLVAAVAAAAWFFLGDSLGLGNGTRPDEDFSHDANLVVGDDAVTLAASGTGSTKTQDADSEAAGQANADPMARGGLVLRGRVVNETRHPVEAAVDVSLAGGEPVHATTGADGRFEVALGDPPSGTVQLRSVIVARGPNDLIALHNHWIWNAQVEETDAGVIVLRKGQPLSVRVMHAGASVPGARVAVFGAGNWGNQALFAEATADEDGRLDIPLVPQGAAHVHAAGGPGTGRGEAKVTIPRGDTSSPLEVDLADERIVDVEVVDKETGDPVAGAKILLGDSRASPPPSGPGYRPELDVPATDEQGRTQIRGLSASDKSRLRLAVVAEGYPHAATAWGGRGRINEKRIKATETDVRIELVKMRTVTFPIKAGDAGVPTDGAELTVSERNFGPMTGASAAVASIRDGELVIENLRPARVNGAVSTKDGLMANFSAPSNKDEGSPVTFVKGSSLHVRLLTKAGEPAPDTSLALQARQGWKLVGPVTTDENGEVRFPATDMKVANLKVMQDAAQWWNAVTVDTIDLTKQKGICVVTMPDESKLTVALRLDGKARLPTTYWLTLGNRYIAPSNIEERPDAGELVVSLRMEDGEKPINVSMTADGHLPASKEVAREDLGKPIVLELKPSATFIVRYTKPESGRFNLRAQRWKPEEEKWVNAWGNNNFRSPRPPEENTQRFEGMDAGRYRILEQQSRMTSEPFDVELGAPPTEVYMDLSVLTFTEGRIELPDGYNVRQARVSKETGSQDRGRGTAARKDGTFQLRSVRGEPLELTVTHPLLVAAKTGGIAKTKGGAQNVVLRLEPGSEVQFKVAGLDLKGSRGPVSDEERMAMERVLVESGGDGPIAFSGRGRVPVSFRVYRGGTLSGDPLRRGTPIAEEGVLRIGGLEPGTYSFFMERSGFAPKRMVGVELGKGVKDLGTIAFSEGSKIKVTLVSPDGKPLPNAWGRLRCLGTPTYNRSAHNRGKPELQFSGLGAGRFQLAVTVQGTNPYGPGGDGGKIFDKEVAVDGSNDMAITVEVKD